MEHQATHIEPFSFMYILSVLNTPTLVDQNQHLRLHTDLLCSRETIFRPRFQVFVSAAIPSQVAFPSTSAQIPSSLPAFPLLRCVFPLHSRPGYGLGFKEGGQNGLIRRKTKPRTWHLLLPSIWGTRAVGEEGGGMEVLKGCLDGCLRGLIFCPLYHETLSWAGYLAASSNYTSVCAVFEGLSADERYSF